MARRVKGNRVAALLLQKSLEEAAKKRATAKRATGSRVVALQRAKSLEEAAKKELRGSKEHGDGAAAHKVSRGGS